MSVSFRVIHEHTAGEVYAVYAYENDYRLDLAAELPTRELAEDVADALKHAFDSGYEEGNEFGYEAGEYDGQEFLRRQLRKLIDV